MSIEIGVIYSIKMYRETAQGGKLNYTETYFLENTKAIFLPLFCSLTQSSKVTFHNKRHFKEKLLGVGGITRFPRNLWTTGMICFETRKAVSDKAKSL